MKKTILFAMFFALGGWSKTVFTQVMVKDIHPGYNGSMGSFPQPYMSEFQVSNQSLYFVANDGNNGNELYKTDGTEAGTVLVKDIAPGTLISSSRYLTDVNGTLFFSAGSDGNNYTFELWKSNGTNAGTTMVKDIRPGVEGSMPTGLINYNGNLYFSANDSVHGPELWKSDGTSAGTVLLKETTTGSSGGNPDNFILFNSYLFFYANDQSNGVRLWKTDGTSAGTVKVKNNVNVSSSNGVVNDILYFRGQDNTSNTYGYELWKTDGTDAGTVMVKDINPGSSSSNFKHFNNVNGTLLFFAYDGTNGMELWKSDGTDVGTVMVKDINPGSSSGIQDYFSAVANGILYFTANDGINGSELWKSDGTTSGTQMIKNISPGAGSSNPAHLYNFNNTIYFQATDYGTTNFHGYELWKTDGTEAGTVMVKDIYPGSDGSSLAAPVIIFDNQLYLTASNGVNGTELWKYDGNSTASINSLGIDNVLTIYPNPAQTQLTISAKDDQLVSLQITDLNGKLLSKQFVSGKSVEIKVENFDAGIYLITIETEKGIVVKRFVKK